MQRSLDVLRTVTVKAIRPGVLTYSYRMLLDSRLPGTVELVENALHVTLRMSLFVFRRIFGFFLHIVDRPHYHASCLGSTRP